MENTLFLRAIRLKILAEIFAERLFNLSVFLQAKHTEYPSSANSVMKAPLIPGPAPMIKAVFISSYTLPRNQPRIQLAVCF